MLKKLLTAASLGVVLASGTAAAADVTSMSWDQIVAQAKQEGQVSWFVWYFQPRFREAVKPFEDKYGIKVTIPEGTLDGNMSKLVAEQKRSAGDIDVMATGSGSLNTIKPAELFYSLQGVLPDAAKLRTKLGGVDSKGYAYAYWGNQTGIAYDPDKIATADLPQSLDAVAAFIKGHPGEFGLNYENGGSGPAFIQEVARNTVKSVDFSDGSAGKDKIAALTPAWDWFKALGEDYVITASNADTLVRINDGELAMGPAWEDHLAGLQAKGEITKRIKYYIPKFGMKGDGNFAAVPKNAPHPAAALLFIDWLTSAETQANFNKVFGSVPMNPDASDQFALVSKAERANSVTPVPEPFATAIVKSFIENVALDR